MRQVDILRANADEIRDMYLEQGLLVQDIADTFHVTASSVRIYLSRNGITLSGKSKTASWYESQQRCIKHHIRLLAKEFDFEAYDFTTQGRSRNAKQAGAVIVYDPATTDGMALRLTLAKQFEKISSSVFIISSDYSKKFPEVIKDRERLL